jgi:hypothetical protein
VSSLGRLSIRGCFPTNRVKCFVSINASRLPYNRVGPQLSELEDKQFHALRIRISNANSQNHGNYTIKDTRPTGAHYWIDILYLYS